MPQRQLIPARRLAWLQQELAQSREAGLVDDAPATAIAGRYDTSSRSRAARILVTLGAALVGVGIIWLVAANLDIGEAGPLARFAFVAALWLGSPRSPRSCAGATASAPLTLLAAIAHGATILQVAQSLRVPAYEPWLLAAWSGGALAYAYATGSAGPARARRRRGRRLLPAAAHARRRRRRRVRARARPRGAGRGGRRGRAPRARALRRRLALRRRARGVALAIAAIVLFVAIQSFGPIAPRFSGAALVLAVGAILVVCGLAADRGRRRLLREMAS